MRYGRITEVNLIDSYILTGADSVDDLNKDKLSKLIGDEEEPYASNKWKILEKNDEKYTVTAKWLSFKSHEIGVNENVGTFPFNITKWENKFDMDIEIGTENRNVGDTSGEQTKVLSADVTIYNPPKEVSNNAKLRKLNKLINGEYEKIRGVSGLNKFINIKSGYYGKHGKNIPNIFRGRVEAISVENTGGEVSLRLIANGSAECNETLNRTKQYVGRVDKVVEELCKDVNATPGRVVYEYLSDGNKKSLKIDYDDDFKVTRGTSVLEAMSGKNGIKKILNEKYSLKPKLKVATTTGTVNLVPKNWSVYAGYEITKDSGLTNIRQKKSMKNDSDLDTGTPPFTVETLFLPSIRYKDMIKTRMSDKHEWKYLTVESFNHTINHNETAITKLSCNRVDNVTHIIDGEEVYSLKSVNPYSRNETGYDVYTLTG